MANLSGKRVKLIHLTNEDKALTTLQLGDEGTALESGNFINVRFDKDVAKSPYGDPKVWAVMSGCLMEIEQKKEEVGINEKHSKMQALKRGNSIQQGTKKFQKTDSRRTEKGMQGGRRKVRSEEKAKQQKK